MDVLCASSQMKMFERPAPFAPSRLIGAVADDPLLSCAFNVSVYIKLRPFGEFAYRAAI